MSNIRRRLDRIERRLADEPARCPVCGVAGGRLVLLAPGYPGEIAAMERQADDLRSRCVCGKLCVIFLLPDDDADWWKRPIGADKAHDA